MQNKDSQETDEEHSMHFHIEIDYVTSDNESDFGDIHILCAGENEWEYSDFQSHTRFDHSRIGCSEYSKLMLEFNHRMSALVKEFLGPLNMICEEVNSLHPPSASEPVTSPFHDTPHL